MLSPLPARRPLILLSLALGISLAVVGLACADSSDLSNVPAGSVDTNESTNALLESNRRGTNAVDLAVALEQVTVDPVGSGTVFALRWVIANSSVGSVSGTAEAQLLLPAQVEFIDTSCPSLFNAGIVTWTPPSVDNAAPRQCVVNLRSIGTEAKVLTFTTQVAASPSDTDTDAGNNSTTLLVRVERGTSAPRELPVGGWPAGMALFAGLVVCARTARRRLKRSQEI